ncbi:hypothetical protein [Granulicella sp. dw_53]|uniref:hypothetical protein n=1 Tax=Granulicella sp. dw_53 TaxID=2719792 RepID=UPI001BD51912|nr:hypothetical protein [Granulicella sp. dw_53]
MDSTVAGEGGFITEGILGYMWSSGTAKTGTSALTRFYDNQPASPNAGDHALVVDQSPVAHPQNLPFYASEAALGYGYARYPGTDVSLASVYGGGVEVKSNIATGCAVWEWWWNGVQFINDYDYGRQLQAAMYPTGSQSSLEEAGDTFGTPDINVDARHPSPCVSIVTSGSTQSTAAVPIDWNPSNFGGDADHPVIYPDVTIGKTITLDWVGPDNQDRHWPLALYQTIVHSAAMNEAVVEAPTGYLNAQFNNYYYYNPISRSLTTVPLLAVQQGTSAGTGYDVPLNPGPQAVILASGTTPTSMAMGIFVNSPNAGFVFYDNSGGPSQQYGSNFAKWEVHYDGGITTGTWTFKTWIMTDTLQNVTSYIDQLNTWGLTSR